MEKSQFLDGNKLKISLFLITALFITSCKKESIKENQNKYKSEIVKKKDAVRDTIRDIYIGKHIYTGGELHDFILEDYRPYRKNKIDSLSYAVYTNQIIKSNNYIFSLEKFIKNDDTEEYIIIDTVNFKNYNSKDFVIKENILKGKVELEIYLKNKKIKSWNFNSKKDFSILGRWNLNCDNLRNIIIKENSASFVVIDNQLAINMIKKEESTNETYSYKLDKKPTDMGSGAASLNWDDFDKNKEIAQIRIIDNNSIEFTWLGFYNFKTKQRELTDCDFTFNSEMNPVILKKCD